jgi:hypothetical protein
MFPAGTDRPQAETERGSRFGPWRLGVISNPLSGGNKRGFEAIRRLLAEHPGIPHHEVRSAAAVGKALEELARRDVNLIAVNSGDGTVQAVLTALFNERPFKSLPLLALIRGGTTNMTSWELGIRSRPLAALKRLIAWAHHGEGESRRVDRPVLEIRYALHGPPLYGLFFGAACIHRGIQFFHARVHKLGLSGDPAHALVVARFLAALASRNHALTAPVNAVIRADGVEITRRPYLLILASTLERLILGLRPYWGRQNAPLRATAIGARPKRLGGALTSLVNGKPRHDPGPENGYWSANAREIQIEMEGGFAVDGELFHSDPKRGPLSIRASEPVQFLQFVS